VELKEAANGIARMDRMRSGLGLAVALGCALAFAFSAQAQTQPQGAASKQQTVAGKRKPKVVIKRWRGYGFLPGYRQPDLNSTHPAKTYHYWQGRTWDGYPVGSWGTGGYGGMWYRGRFTNGIGPCWTRTPIGPMWNCG
jgi:hypothetical protein